MLPPGVPKVILRANPVVAFLEISNPVGAVNKTAPRGPVAFRVNIWALDALPTLEVKLPKLEGVIAI
jgi:hypothetical protein